MIRSLSVLLFFCGVASCAAMAQVRPTAPVTVTVDRSAQGPAIPRDFSGLSFERGTLNSNNAGVSGYLFSPSNTQLVTLFQNLGIHSLRVGAGSVDSSVPAGYNPDGFLGIDALFDFAQVAGPKVIYGFRMLNTRNTYPNLKSQAATVATHIWQRNSSLVDNFEIGNEPDWHNPYHTSGDPAIYETVPNVPGSAYPSYRADWNLFAGAITTAVPAARFSGPDTGAYSTLTFTPDAVTGVSWTEQFAKDENGSLNGTGSRLLAEASQHHYVGGSPGTTTTTQAIDNMLSRSWVTGTAIAKGPEGTGTYTPYPWMYSHILAPTQQAGAAYRMTEANDVLTGINGASNGYSAALWALDYMQWWAARGMAGVNFHNKQWILTDTIVPSPNPCVGTCGNYQTTAKGYGMKAFDLGSHGYVTPVAVSNPQNANVTAYAVASGRDLYVTLINKTHTTTSDVTDAVVTIQPGGASASSAAAMVLTDGVPGNAALMTATLGGAAITNSGRWLGKWAPLGPEANGSVTVTVPSASAAVVRLRAAGNFAGPVQMAENGSLELFGVHTDPSVQNFGHNPSLAPGRPQGGPVWLNLQKAPADSSAQGWTGWSPLGTGVTATGSPAVVRNLDTTLQVFVPTLAGDVFSAQQTAPGAGFGDWTDMGTSSSGVKSLTAANNADGSLSVFGLGTNGNVWQASQSAPGVGWSAWTDLGGQPLQPGFVVGQNLNGDLAVFGVTAGGQVWTNHQANAASWSGWTELPGPAMSGGLAVAGNLDGRLEVFGLDADGGLWHDTQVAPGGDWTGWQPILGAQLEPGFTIGQNSDGRLEVIGVRGGSQTPFDHLAQSANRGGHGVIAVAQTVAGAGYGAWTELGGMTVDAANPKLVVGSTADGRIQIFAAGADHQVWSNWQTSPSGEWAGWSLFGGSRISF